MYLSLKFSALLAGEEPQGGGGAEHLASPQHRGGELRVRGAARIVLGLQGKAAVLAQGLAALARGGAVLQKVAGIQLYTTQPGIQLYTGNFLQDCPTPGKGGVPLQKYGGFALETQHFPCSPSHPEFPTTILRAGKVFRANTTLRFFTGRQCGRL